MSQVVATMESSIGAFEAMAQRSRLLRALEQGEQFTISVRGRPVADVVPHHPASSQSMAAAILTLQAFPRIRGIRDADVASFVAEGPR